MQNEKSQTFNRPGFSGFWLMAALAVSMLFSSGLNAQSNTRQPDCCWSAFPNKICLGDPVFTSWIPFGNSIFPCIDTLCIDLNFFPPLSSAYIDWGDGNTTPLTSFGNCYELVDAGHTYATSGTYLPHVVTVHTDGTIYMNPAQDSGCSGTGFIVVGADVSSLDDVLSQINGTSCTGSAGYSYYYKFGVDPSLNFDVILDWGDGTVDSINGLPQGTWSNGLHSYSLAGTYTLTATYYIVPCGNDTASFQVMYLKQLEVGPQSVDFTASVDCNTSNVTFNPFPDCPNTNNDFRLFWNFGDGSTLIQNGGSAWNNVSHVYSSNGSFTVTLQVQQLNSSNTWVTIASSSLQVIEIQNLPFPNVSTLVNNLCDTTALTYTIDNFTSYGPNAQFSILDPSGIISQSSISGNQFSVSFLSSGIFQLQVSQSGCPDRIVDIRVFDCCNTDPPPYNHQEFVFNNYTKTIDFNNTTLSQAITAQQLPQLGVSGNSDILIRINGVLTIDQDYYFSGCRILMGPEARIEYENGTQLSLVISESLIQACSDYMWDGIYLKGNYQNLTLTESHIMEADNGIVSKNEANLQISGNLFLANWYSIQIEDHNSPFQVICNNCQSHVQISSNDFNTEWQNYSNYGIQGSSTLLLPYDGGILLNQLIWPWSRGYASIFIKNSQGVIIESGNTFANTAFGIISEDGSLKSVNNNFVNLGEYPYNFPYSQPYWGAGIYGYRVYGNIVGVKAYRPRIEVVNNGSAGFNQFSQCKLGIFTDNVSTKVSDAQFTDTYDGVILRNPESLSEIKNSVFLNVQYITPMRSAIRVRNVFPEWSDVKVKDNDIDGYKHGVFATNLEGYNSTSPQITDNDIRYTDPSYTGTFNGIYLEGCVGATVKSNSIEMTPAPSTSSPPQWWGITVAESQNCHITQNNIKHMQEAIRCAGNLHDTKFTCNDFDASTHGFYFVNGPNVATYISDQYINNNGSPEAAGNRWLNHSQNTYRMDGEVNSSCVNWYFTGAGDADNQVFNPKISPGYIDTALESPTFIQHPFSPSNSACVPPGPGGGELPEIRDGLILYEQLFSESVYRSEEYTYRRLYYEDETRNEPIPEEIAMENYYQSLESRNLGAFLEAQELISEGEFQQARLLISGIVSENPIETAKRDAFLAYLDEYVYSDSTFTPQTQSDMTALAYNTPYVHGEGVFYARVMLGLLTADMPVPYSDGAEAPEVEEVKWANVYPNPVGDETYLVPEQALDVDLQVTITDVSGKVIQTLSLTAGEPFLRIPGQNWSAGVYIMTVQGPDKVQVERLVKN